MNPKDFRQAYFETVYRAAGVAFRFSSLQTGVVLYGGRPFALLTAANPRSEAFPDEENATLNARMRHDLESKGWAITESLGTDVKHEWLEPGFLVWDAPLPDILEIGRRFGQNAVVFGEAGRVALVWCDDAELEWFNAELYADPV
jgi:Protein of unknown function (DUF3293)